MPVCPFANGQASTQLLYDGYDVNLRDFIIAPSILQPTEAFSTVSAASEGNRD